MYTIMRISLLLVLLSLLLGCASRDSSVPQQKMTSTPIYSPSRFGHATEAMVSGSYVSGTYVCQSAERFRRQVIGNGHCVSLIQHCSTAPLTRYWREGERVRGLNLKPGTIIATFRDGQYPNQTGWHAAIYISQDEQGIWVWDQWKGKPVHRRLIRFKSGRGTPNNDGDAYSVVR